MEKLGVIGFGSLGQLLGKGFAGNYKINYFDPKVSVTGYEKHNTLKEIVANSDVLIIAIPSNAFEKVITEISQCELKDKLIIDVLSTKLFAKQIYQKHLIEHENILSLHPLFGPPSYIEFEPGLRMVSSYKVGPKAEHFEEYLENKYNFKIINKTAEEHDRHMAVHHAIPFFLAHALSKTDFNKDPGDLTIPSEEKLRKIVDIASKESMDLYLTIMRSNPYAQQAVDDLLKSLQSEQDNLWP